MKIISHLLVLSIFMILSPAFGQSWKTYPYTPAGSLLSFPLDEGRHEGESIEWWYTAGHLIGDFTGNEYSFMVSYFYFPIYGYDGFRIFNLSNENTGAFYRDTRPLIYRVMSSDSLNIQATVDTDIQEFWQNRTDETGHMVPFEYLLSVSTGQDSLDLAFVSLKPPLILADSGLFNQGANSYTYYFSLTKNSVAGDIAIRGIQEPVSGTAWIDRQFGSYNPLTREEYEWFSIQLSNDMDINLWNIFTRSREIPTTSAYRIMSVYQDENTQFTTADIQVERLSFQFMPDSARCYAQQWHLTSPVNNLDLIITTRHHNSEVQLPFRFFEGTTFIEGTVNGVAVTGKGFAELLHSYQNPEVTFTYPSGPEWNSTEPIVWHLANPDEGRPLKYDLSCSIDQRQTFFTIAQGLTDTLYYWNDPVISAGDSCWFRLTAYSIDSTLNQTIFSDSYSIYNPNPTAILHQGKALENRAITLYPNPAENRIMIDFDHHQSFQHWQIHDIFGRTIVEEEMGELDHLEIDTHNLVTGIYFLRFFSEDQLTIIQFIIRK